MADKAVSSRPIPNSNWDLVQTKHGRYFFFDHSEKIASWNPPEDLSELLKRLPENILRAFFDPDTDEDALMNMFDNIPDESVEEEEEQVEFEFDEDETIEYEYDQDEEQNTGEQVSVASAMAHKSPEEAAAQQQTRVTAFMSLLRSRNIDPFKPWAETAKELEKEPAFQAIASGREREALFAALCPELAERVRTERQRKLQEAQDAWKSLLATMTDVKKLPATWTEYSRNLKRSAPWYKLLDAKEMEVQYRAKLKELRDLAVTYNVRSNK